MKGNIGIVGLLILVVIFLIISGGLNPASIIRSSEHCVIIDSNTAKCWGMNFLTDRNGINKGSTLENPEVLLGIARQTNPDVFITGCQFVNPTLSSAYPSYDALLSFSQYRLHQDWASSCSVSSDDLDDGKFNTQDLHFVMNPSPPYERLTVSGDFVKIQWVSFSEVLIFGDFSRRVPNEVVDVEIDLVDPPINEETGKEDQHIDRQKNLRLKIKQ